MPNLKFDRMGALAGKSRSDNPLREIIASKTRFVVLGSVREEEESAVAGLAARLHRKAPDAVIGLFPRHMERIEAWKELLDQQGIPWKLRSEQTGPAEPGTTLLWDAFGELVPAYALARTAFVGGSLAPLGGQNFLEPLTCGIIPVTGPSLHNFAWVGTGIFDSDLAVRADDADGVCQALLRLLDNPPRPADVKKTVRQYIRSRRGGAKTVCKHIAQFINND
jgi:3-deoxy-D-manno-octulosonic-acid transferase